MLRNIAKIFFRKMTKEKSYTFFNIGGLTAGLTFFIIILFYVKFENSYDSFHENGEKIYRVIKEIDAGEKGKFLRADVGVPTALHLEENFPEVEDVVKMSCFYEGTVQYNNNTFRENRFYFADKSIFKYFSFEIIRGSSSPLENPESVVISESMSRKYFGGEDPIGRTLSYKSRDMETPVDFVVSAVMKDIPANSHLEMDFIASFEGTRRFLSDFFYENWDGLINNYAVIKPGSKIAELENKITSYFEDVIPKGNFIGYDFILQPLDEIYFDSSRVGGGFWRVGDKTLTRIFFLISIVVLLLSGVNFINLSTAGAALRAKEIGIRKVFGARKAQLIKQFLAESLFYSLSAAVLAAIVAEMLMPYFYELMGINVAPVTGLGSIFLHLIIIAAFFGIAAGVYPAFYLSGLEPDDAFDGNIFKGGKHYSRKALVVFQFAVSLFLVFSAIAIYNQLGFLKEKELGFDKNNVIAVPVNDREVRKDYDQIKNRLYSIPGVQYVSGTSQMPCVTSTNGIFADAHNIGDEMLQVIYIDLDYAKLLGLDIKKGRDFSSEKDEGNPGILINDKFAEHYNWTEPVGMPMSLYFYDNDKKYIMYETRVTGVLKDFNYRGLTMSVQPAIFIVDKRRFNFILVKVGSESGADIYDKIENVFSEAAPGVPYSTYHLDTSIDNIYLSYERAGNIVLYGTFLAIFLAAFGLYALAAFSTERKSKEIGIRKVLGATDVSISVMLLKDFFKLVIIAAVIALPAGFYFVQDWMENFAYRYQINFWNFLTAVMIISAVTLLTVSYKSIKAALSNPVDSIKQE